MSKVITLTHKGLSMQKEFITQTELAKLAGVSQPYINKLIKKGYFNHCLIGKKLIRECAIQQMAMLQCKESQDFQCHWHKEIDDERLKAMLEDMQSLALYMRVMRDYYAAMAAKEKYRKELSQYYSLKDIQSKTDKVMKAARQRAARLIEELTPQLPSIKDINEAKELLEDHIHTLLNDLAATKV